MVLSFRQSYLHQNQIVALVQSSLSKRRESEKLLEKAKTRVEQLIDKGGRP